MKLSDVIIDYRNKMNISQREFARRCSISNSYISFIEKECDPKTKKPPVPTIQQYKKIADAMGLSLHDLFEMIDDAPVDISFNSSETLSDEEKHLIDLFRGANDQAKSDALDLLEKHQKKDISSMAE